MADLPQSVIDRVTRLLTYGSRTLLGVAGAPGSGKSTLAMAIQAHFPADTQVVPMDGFHLANVELAHLNLAHRKGAPDTFDAAGYLNLLQRIKSQRTEEIIYAPEFDRALEEPIAGAIAIKSGTKLLITEGNYLLLEQAPWCSARELFDEVWFVDVDDPLRRERLVQRHIHFGRTYEEALRWVETTDEPNARRIQQTRHRADWAVSWS
jgi:pantothenate kinase